MPTLAGLPNTKAVSRPPQIVGSLRPLQARRAFFYRHLVLSYF